MFRQALSVDDGSGTLTISTLQTSQRFRTLKRLENALGKWLIERGAYVAERKNTVRNGRVQNSTGYN